jgi:small subunit ribosomal protein S1
MSNETGENAQNPQPNQTSQTAAPEAPAPQEQAATPDTGPTRIEVPSEMSREELSSLYDEAVSKVSEGSLLKGRIANIGRDFVMVDIGYKSEGVIPVGEFGSSLDQYKVGDEIDVYLEKLEDADGLVVLSKIKADRQIRWEETMRRCEEGQKVSGRVMRKVRGGLIVDIGMDAFLPASQVDIKHVAHVEDYIGQTLEFKLIKINPERRNVVVSRRELLEEERARNRQKLIEEIEEGQVRTGMVKNLTDFGAFIDLFGLDGLLHITDMSWGRVGHPSELLEIGQMVRVKVLHFDRERQRIALGLKQLEPNPWDDIEHKYPVGSIVRGRIVSLQPYGAFIELAKGVEGLIHISEMSWTRRISHPSEVLSEGDIVEAMVLSIRPDEQKISLGIKQCEFNPWSVAAEKYPVGARVAGRVRNLTSYGAFVELEEGIDGLIHISDMSWTRKLNHPSEVLQKGQTIECVVLSVSPDDKKITLGLKQLSADPWETVADELHVGDVVEGVVTKLADFGAFVTLSNGIECLVHKSQVADTPTESVDAALSVGQTVRAKVVRIDPQERKIALSIREYLHDEARAAKAGETIEPGTSEVRVADLPKPEAPTALAEHLDEALSTAGVGTSEDQPLAEQAESEPSVEVPQPAEAPPETPPTTDEPAPAEAPAAEVPAAEVPAAEPEETPEEEKQPASEGEAGSVPDESTEDAEKQDS